MAGMNAVSPPIPLIPDNAPFTPAQRAWLNGFLAGLYGGASGAGLSIGTPPEPDPKTSPGTTRPLNSPSA